MNTATCELAVPADAAYLELVGQFVSFVAQRHGFTEREMARLRLATDEACANVVEHSTAESDVTCFTVVCEVDDQNLVVRIRDNGPLFDLEGVREPNLDAPLEKRAVGGLGIYLIRRLMDQVELRPLPSGKELVMTKALPTAGEPSDAD